MVNTYFTNNNNELEHDVSEAASRRLLLLQKKEKIENQLAAISARDRERSRKRDTRMKVIVGAAVLAHARLDAAFASKLNEVLHRAVVRAADRAFIFRECNTWHSAEAELTRSRRVAREPSKTRLEPAPVERRHYQKMVGRYEELKQV